MKGSIHPFFLHHLRHANKVEMTATGKRASPSSGGVLSSPSTSAATSLLSKRKRRIVPEDQRKRIAVSCDRCRKRKLRCRPAENPTTAKGSDASFSDTNSLTLNQSGDGDTCLECFKAGAECTRVLPRKKRVYGSVDTLSLHYQALLLLVQAMFPDEDCESMAGVVSIASKKGIHIPDNLVPEAVPEKAFLAQGDGEKEYSESQGEAKPSEVMKEQSNPAANLRSSAPPSTSAVKFETDKKSFPDMGDERIIYDRVGVPYYVGSSGSMAFFDSLCKIIGKKNEQQRNNQPLFTPTGEAASQVDTLCERTGGAYRSTRENNGVFFYTISASTFADSAMFSLPNIDQVSLLPPKPECDIYMDAFLANVNSVYPLFRVNKLRRKYELYWSDIQSTPQRKNKWESQIDWRCCLYMVIVMGARSLINSKETSRKYGAMSKYASVVQGALSILTVTTSLETVQALFLLSYYFYGINERNAAWLMTGVTCRQAMAMGFHRESACASCSAEEAQERRQIWYYLYSFELTLCANLGRPSCIRLADMDVKQPDGSDDELSVYFAPGTFPANYKLLKFFTEVITVSHLGDFRDLLTFAKIRSTLAKARELRDFLSTLPLNLRELKPTLTGNHARSIMKIHNRTHYTISILSRPFVLYLAGADINQISPEKIDDLIAILNIGATSSIAISQFLKSLAHRGLLNGVYHTDIFYGYCACLVLSLVSVISSSNKFANKNLAYSKETINNAITSIVKTMDSIYLEGTMFRLARVTASILRGLGIDIQYENINKPDFPAKDEGDGNASPTYAEGSSQMNQIVPPSLSPSYYLPQMLLEDYDRVLVSRETPSSVGLGSPSSLVTPSTMPGFDAGQTDISKIYMEDLDLFTKTFNQSFYNVPNTFNFTNVLFPPTLPENTEAMGDNPQVYPSSRQQRTGSSSLFSDESMYAKPSTSIPTENTEPLTAEHINLPPSSGLDGMYDQGDVGVISSMTWLKEDLGRNQLMDYVTKQAKNKPKHLDDK